MEKNRNGMPSPISRSEFEHNVFLTIDALFRHRDNESFLANHMMVIGDSLEHLRLLPNGRFLLSSIDEMLRLHSNMLEWEKYLPPITKNKK